MNFLKGTPRQGILSHTAANPGLGRAGLCAMGTLAVHLIPQPRHKQDLDTGCASLTFRGHSVTWIS